MSPNGAADESVSPADVQPSGAPPTRAIYDIPALYDRLIHPGPCESFYRAEAALAGGPVLELACGTGRLTIPIAADGRDVVGLDASPAMLSAARTKAASAGVAVTFVGGDMRRFELGRRFALVVLSCNSLAHLTTREALVECLRSASHHLDAGGRFAFDIVNPDIAALARSAIDVVERDYGAHIVVRETSAYDSVAQVRTAHWHVAAPSELAGTLSPLVLRQIFPQELPLLLEAGGLRLVARYGDFERGPFRGDSSNQICLAEPAA